MPKLGGLDASKAIRGSGKAYANIPIVALTADAIKGNEQSCAQAEMDFYVSKPIDYEKLFAILSKLDEAVRLQGTIAKHSN